MEKVDKKTIVLVSIVVLVLLIVGLVFGLTKKSGLFSTSTQQQYTQEDKGMPWKVAVDLIQKGLIEKIQVIDELTIRVFVKEQGISKSFVVTQPTQDAYIQYVPTSPNPVNIVK